MKFEIFVIQWLISILRKINEFLFSNSVCFFHLLIFYIKFDGFAIETSMYVCSFRFDVLKIWLRDENFKKRLNRVRNTFSKFRISFYCFTFVNEQTYCRTKWWLNSMKSKNKLIKFRKKKFKFENEQRIHFAFCIICVFYD